MGETSPDLEDRMTDCDLTLTPSRGDSGALEDGTVSCRQ